MVAGLEEISKGELYINNKLVNDVEPKDRILPWYSKAMLSIPT